jgi:hypothetical protein
MIQIESAIASMSISGKGEANQPEPDLFEARLRTVVRYADPAAWITAAAVARAVAPLEKRRELLRDTVGVLVVSDEGPQEAMQALDETSQGGFSSPLKFPAANPGSLVGVSCILLGFRGPTTNLIMPLASGVSVALVLAARLLERQVVRYAVIAACSRTAETSIRARALLLSTTETGEGQISQFEKADAAWLGAGRSPSEVRDHR